MSGRVSVPAVRAVTRKVCLPLEEDSSGPFCITTTTALSSASNSASLRCFLFWTFLLSKPLS
ncbi:hypothetical protein HID58_015223 [Brassica napus]|uniref:Uncharacterized protein n=1 Tax=Brassica napus TaxID=3708 RepID=A0ABQ8DLY4_BRANA|nr:hypothetical protein HID58_015223 [Brassica napus]